MKRSVAVLGHRNGPEAPQKENLTEVSWLRSTLAAYEVEEIEGHELVRILPQVIPFNGAANDLQRIGLDDE